MQLSFGGNGYCCGNLPEIFCTRHSNTARMMFVFSYLVNNDKNMPRALEQSSKPSWAELRQQYRRSVQ